jgi:hypothetical protein
MGVKGFWRNAVSFSIADHKAEIIKANGFVTVSEPACGA